MKKYLLPILMLLMVSTTTWGRSIELDMHNKALGFNYINSESIIIQGMGVEAGFLIKESVKPLIYLGLSVAGKNISESGTFDVNLGGRFYSLQESGNAFSSIALGGKISFSPINRVGLSGHLYFAPDITTFGDSNGVTDLMIRADYQVIPQAFAYIGYRQIDSKLPAATANLDDNFHVGIKLLF